MFLDDLTHGDAIRAIVELGGKRPRPADGIFLQKDGAEFLCKIYGQSVKVSEDKLWKLIKLDMAALEQWGKDNLADLQKYVEIGLKKFGADGEYKCEPEESILYVADFSIQPEICEERVLTGIKQFPGWGISVWSQTYGTRYEPPDSIEKNVGQYRNSMQAAKALFEALRVEESNAFWDNVSADEEAREELERRAI